MALHRVHNLPSANGLSASVCTFHRRVQTSCDLEDVPRAGKVSFSVADAKRNGAGLGMHGFLGLRSARWGSPALHPRLSKSAALPLKARWEHEFKQGQGRRGGWSYRNGMDPLDTAPAKVV